MENNLKKKTVVGMVWSIFQRFGKMGIAFIANLVMARLLTPDDYGTIGILMIFIALSMVFIDAGFGNALIQKTNPTEKDYTTIFYFNLFISGIIYIILFFAAPAIATFYKMDSLCGLLRVLSLVLIINAMSIIQDCRLRKEMNFKVLSISTIVSAILGAVAGIYAAKVGYGVWSLVIYNIVEAISRTIMLWIMCRWLPLICFSLESLKQLFRFGGFLLANSFLFTLRRSAIPIFMGKLFSASDLGYYTQAKKVEEVPVSGIQSIIGQVTFPLFAAVKEDKNKLREAQRKGNIFLAFICVPMMTVLFVLSQDLIVGLYTEKWAAAIPYLRILCLCGIFVSLQEVNANVITALGYSGLYFKWSIVKTIVLFVFLFVGSFIGIYGMLTAWLLQNFIAYIINAILSGRFTKYPLMQQFADLLPIIIVSILSGLAVWFWGELVYLNLWVDIMAKTILFGLVYFGGFFLMYRSYLLGFLDIVRVIKR